MRNTFAAFGVAVSLLAGGAQAQEAPAPQIDVTARIDRCVSEYAASNKKVSRDIISAYCTCMSDKMGPTERKAITKWESDKKHDVKQCEKKSGWF